MGEHVPSMVLTGSTDVPSGPGLAKAPTGARRLDQITGGGLPLGRVGAKRVVLDTIEVLFGAFGDDSRDFTGATGPPGARP